MGRQIGRFVVRGKFFQRLEPGEGMNLFSEMLVLDVRRDWVSDTVEYFGVHPQFREISEREITPEYVAHFGPDSAFPIWREKVPNAEITGSPKASPG